MKRAANAITIEEARRLGLLGGKRRNKYGAETVARQGGGRFRSKKEAKAWSDTRLAVLAKVYDFAALWPVFPLAGVMAEYDILEGFLIGKFGDLPEPPGQGWRRAWVRFKDAKGKRTPMYKRNKKQTKELFNVEIVEV